jgi:hypothetical protein
MRRERGIHKCPEVTGSPWRPGMPKPLNAEIPKGLFDCGWRVCKRCPPDDNVWPETSFINGTTCRLCYTLIYGARKKAKREALARAA